MEVFKTMLISSVYLTITILLLSVSTIILIAVKDVLKNK